ncbi:MAG TPA: hypothetical protein VGB04_04890 [Allosphingosinicella sp.]|jgi:hypothetical protein
MEEDPEGAAASPSPRRRRRLFDARAEAAVVKALRGGATLAAAAKAAGFGVSTVYGAKARSASFRALCEAAAEESDGDVVIAPGNGRKLQFRRVRRRLFGAKLKDAFLEHFAATCSIAAAAEAVGVGRSTVNNHLAEDEDFRARFDRALEIGYRQLDAELVCQRLEAAARRSRRRTSTGRCSCFASIKGGLRGAGPSRGGGEGGCRRWRATRK